MMTVLHRYGGPTDPARNAAVVTPNDDVDLDIATRGLFVGVSGDVKVTLLNGGTVLLKNVAAGVIHAMQVSRVWATTTDATDIVAVW